MTESEDAEFARQMDKGKKVRNLVPHTGLQPYERRGTRELESLFSNGEEFDPMAVMQISTNMMMSSLTNQGLSSAIVAALGFSFVIKIAIGTKLVRIAAVSVTLASYYGYIQEAAEAAHRLRQLSPIFYQALYAEKLEMLYFLIEPVINKNVHLFSGATAEDDIAGAIMQVLR
jgi:hypothetical protein